jgi:Flp pilus assembly protein TadG
MPQEMANSAGRQKRRGQTLVEFAACSVLALCLVLSVIEFGRLILAYTTINNAARVGVRYAIVNGLENTGSSSTTTLTTNVQTIVDNYLGAAAIDTSSATVTVSYPGFSGGLCASGSNAPGCPVQVQVSYPYQTMVSYFPLHVTLVSQAEGVFTF